MSSTNSRRIAAFRRAVWKHYKAHGRHDLPWRKTTDPYKILVSEVMLQQTQVPRVIGKYNAFIKKFPNVRALARAPLSEVLKEWSGLGYNRRAKYLHDAARIVQLTYGGDFRTALRGDLPGVGPYTKAAVLAFAYNESVVMLETNIRTALIHTFYRGRSSEKVGDGELMGLMAEVVAREKRPREFYWALMDYGAHLKQSGVRNNAKSAHYKKQSKFKGSLREARGAILRELHRGPSSAPYKGRSSVVLRRALAGLERDGLIKQERGKWRIA